VVRAGRGQAAAVWVEGHAEQGNRT
jgi:hypothetical protein